MRAILACSIAAAFALGSLPLAAETPDEAAPDDTADEISTQTPANSRAERGEARLARMIEGRTAGEPANCITAFNSQRLQVIEHVGIVYDGGGTVWVARASHPRDLGSFDVPIIERHGSQLCTSDIIRTVDRSTGMFSGAVFLESFVPYRKTAEG